MDVASGAQMMMKSNIKGKRKRSSSSSSSSSSEKVKVVYISSPMKVRTCASRFRDLVQELTGRESDVSRFMELNGAAAWFDDHDHDHDHQLLQQRPKIITTHHHHHPMLDPPHQDQDQDQGESPTSSGSIFLEPSSLLSHDQLFTSDQIDQYFSGVFSSNLFSEPLRLDVLGTYESL